MALSAQLLAALENLRRKKAGEDVNWINIADARALTELGLAQRTGGGWIITAAGTSALADRDGNRPGRSPPDMSR
ncbi:MAG: hypothetical protein ACHP84_05375 [Caulobacterales bacterium]